MKRHNGRVLTVLCLYNVDVNKYKFIGKNEDDECIKCFERVKKLETEYDYAVEIDYDYSEKCFVGVLENIDAIDEIISKSLVKYTIDRLSYVDRAIIRLATYEMIKNTAPINIIIDEALQITREYAGIDDDSQVKFNNKVLDTISKNVHE